ncbi:MAG: 16S rRNA processing protein RimM [Nitrospirae bacterium]|nr:MAG: 16S rRNA processing protein RimM [Nitrospirota bacterium]
MGKPEASSTEATADATTVATDWVAVGKIVKPFGVRGDVRVLSLSDVPGRIQGLKQVMLVAPSGRTVSALVTRLREECGGFVVGFDVFSTPEEAAVFRGGLIQIARDQAPPLPDGQYYECDLIGVTVRDEAGQLVGTLEEIMATGGHPVFAVRREGKEVLIPATRSVVVSVDLARRTMTVRGIEELLDV